MKTFGKSPDDLFYENINPYLKMWLYESWIHDQELESEKLRNQAILIGSFFNPEMAQKMLKIDNPDFQSSNLDETTAFVRERILESEKQKSKKKRKKRKVVE